MVWYVEILGKEPLIRPKDGKRSPWTIPSGSATPVLSHKYRRRLVSGLELPRFL